MATLYEIKEQYLDLIEQGFVVDEETGEILLDESNLLQVEDALDEKLENYALYIKNLKSDIEQIKAEESNLKSRRDIAQKKVERMTKFLMRVMEETGTNKLETPKVAASIRKSKRVEIYDEMKLRQLCPEAFDIQEPKLSKTKLRKILDNLTVNVLNDCAAIEENFNLQIK